MQLRSSLLTSYLLLVVGSKTSCAFAANERGATNLLQQRHLSQFHLQQEQQQTVVPWTASSCLTGGFPRGGSTRSKPLAAATGEVGVDASVASSETDGSAINGASLASSTGAGEGPETDYKPLKIVFLSSDTGGGHRASAEALAKQFLIKYPGSTYELVDVWTDHGVLPYRTIKNSYKRMSSKPWQWRIFYHLSNTRLNRVSSEFHSQKMCGGKIRRRLESLQPDVVISVHPAMNFTPLKETIRISKNQGKHIPVFTVVTDLGSAHRMWFSKHVDKLYVASERLRVTARKQGRTPDENIVLTGLPIRHDFAVQADKLGDRTSETGKQYQHQIRQQVLGDDVYDPSKKMVLIMGGGEGVGGLSEIVDQMYIDLVNRGVDATICVVCGRNEKLKTDLEARDWGAIIREANEDGGEQSAGRRRRRRRNRRRTNKTSPLVAAVATPGNVNVVGLGFVTNMAEYMAASDVLVTKAGPGTIAEAASVGLPVMLTSFLPGQEAGNVDVVLESGYGAFDKNPEVIGETVSGWLLDESKLAELSKAASRAGNPNAAKEIADDIGKHTQNWIKLNEGV